MVISFPLGKLVYGYSSSGEMAMVFPLRKLVLWLLPTGGEGGLHGYSPLGSNSTPSQQ